MTHGQLYQIHRDLETVKANKLNLTMGKEKGQPWHHRGMRGKSTLAQRVSQRRLEMPIVRKTQIAESSKFLEVEARTGQQGPQLLRRELYPVWLCRILRHQAPQETCARRVAEIEVKNTLIKRQNDDDYDIFKELHEVRSINITVVRDLDGPHEVLRENETERKVIQE